MDYVKKNIVNFKDFKRRRETGTLLNLRSFVKITNT
jgi:hypothetical protein